MSEIRVLVTGASGFIGRHFLPLIVEPFEVHGVRHRSEGEDHPGVIWHDVDLLDDRERSRLMAASRPTHLVHLAWVTEHGEYWSSASNLDWVAASLQLLREFERAGGQRALLIGTCAEYDWTLPGPYSEDSPTGPETLYGKCKLATGDIASGFAEGGELSLVWARLFHLYGPGEHPERLVPALIRAALQGERPTPRSPGSVLDLMYVEDVALAIRRLLDSEFEGIVNVCTGRPTRLGDLAAQISEGAGLGAATITNQDSNQEIVGDPGRLESEVGLEARPMSEGLSDTIEWWRGLLATESKIQADAG